MVLSLSHYLITTVSLMIVILSEYRTEMNGNHAIMGGRSERTCRKFIFLVHAITLGGKEERGRRLQRFVARCQNYESGGDKKKVV